MLERGRDRRATDLPSRAAGHARRASAAATIRPVHELAAAKELAVEMLQGGESFWSVVHPFHGSRPLPRTHLKIIASDFNGPRQLRMVVQLFNMPPSDYKRFLGFLRKHDCLLRFHAFRMHPLHRRTNASLA